MRTAALMGGGTRSGLVAVIYHGMLHGLLLIATHVTPIQQRSTDQDHISLSATIDQSLVCQLANLVLQSQQEVKHVH